MSDFFDATGGLDTPSCLGRSSAILLLRIGALVQLKNSLSHSGVCQNGVIGGRIDGDLRRQGRCFQRRLACMGGTTDDRSILAWRSSTLSTWNDHQQFARTDYSPLLLVVDAVLVLKPACWELEILRPRLTYLIHNYAQTSLASCRSYCIR